MEEILLSKDKKKHKKKQKKQEGEKKQKMQLEGICTKVTLVIGLVSTMFFWVCKYISIGRIEYFEFDMKYYDYSLSYVSKGIFFVYLGFIVVGAMFSIALIVICARLEKKYGDKVKYFEVYYFFVTMLIVGIIIFFLAKNIISYGGLNIVLGLFNVEIFVAIYSMIYVFNIGKVDKHNCKWVVCVMGVLLVGTGIFSLKKSEYDNAKEQDKFEIIKEGFDSGDDSYQYVVISSSSERYSAYLCEIIRKDNNTELRIIKNVHKYFPYNSTETVELKFSKVLYDELSYEESGIMKQAK